MEGVGVTQMPSRFVLDTEEDIGNIERIHSAYLECENIARAASSSFFRFLPPSFFLTNTFRSTFSIKVKNSIDYD